MINATTQKSIPMTFDEARVNDHVIVTGNTPRHGVITRKTARRIYVTCTDGSTAHINASTPYGRLRANLTKQRITTTPTDSAHAYRLASQTPAFRIAKNMMNQAVSYHGLAGARNLATTLDQAACIALTSFETTTYMVRHMVMGMITTTAQDHYNSLADKMKFLEAMSALYSNIAPTSMATDTWQITTQDDNILGYVHAADTDTAVANARKTFTHAQLKNGFSRRRLTEAELTERGL